MGFHLGLYAPKIFLGAAPHPGSYNDTVDDITAIAVGAWGMIFLLLFAVSFCWGVEIKIAAAAWVFNQTTIYAKIL